MTNVNEFLYDGASAFIGRKGTINKPFYYEGKFWTVDTLFYTFQFKNISPKFTYCLFQKINWIKYNEASGVPSLSKATIEKIKVNIPSIEEQNKITNILFAIDRRIATQNKIIDKLQSLIKGLIKRLQMSGTEKGSWRKQYLRDLLIERKEFNRNGCEVYSVSVSQGVINQVEYLGRSFAAKDVSNYPVVRFGDIVYTKSPTGNFPYGIVKRSEIIESVAVSPLYGVYEPSDFNIGILLHYYFSSPINAINYLHPLIQKGAKNTINITNQHFLDNEIVLPLKKEDIENIALTLLSLQDKIETSRMLLNMFERQKSYLLSNLFI